MQGGLFWLSPKAASKSQKEIKMRILNIEDDAIKHNDICKVIKSCGSMKIDWARNLEAGVERIREGIQGGTPYDLVITDMWYPREAGGEDEESGAALIQLIQQEKWELPVILCSSVRYRIPGILGAIHYSKNENWEDELKKLIK